MNISMQVVGCTLIHFVWQGSAIGLVVAAALSLTERRSPNVRYLVACAGLAAMLAAPAATGRLLWSARAQAAVTGEGFGFAFDQVKPWRSSDAGLATRAPFESSARSGATSQA